MGDGAYKGNQLGVLLPVMLEALNYFRCMVETAHGPVNTMLEYYARCDAILLVMSHAVLQQNILPNASAE